MWTKGMSGKKSVELRQSARPSRIRRDPVRTSQSAPAKIAWWRTSEWEIRLSVTGITLFAIAIFIITLGVSDFTSS